MHIRKANGFAISKFRLNWLLNHSQIITIIQIRPKIFPAVFLTPGKMASF